VTVSEKLLGLIETGELDWDNERHREAYLKAWVKGELGSKPLAGRPEPEPEPEPDGG